MAPTCRQIFPDLGLRVNCTDLYSIFAYPPLPSLPPPISVGGESISEKFSPLVIIVFAVLGGAFLLISYYAVVVKYCSSFNRSRIIPPQPDNNTLEDFIDEDHGPEIDHPIWFIRTVGLPDNIINSINVYKYQKGEGLVEGTDCSVCLGEFQEDETLRLLPKCNHAFHIPCIDTWLRSHTNCPLCRAPIVSNSAASERISTTTETNLSNSGIVDETQLENSARDETNQNRESGGVSDVRIEIETGTEEEDDDVELRVEEDVGIRDTAVLSISGVDPQEEEEEEEEEGDIQPVRRSFSMDSLAAAMVCFSIANSHPLELEGSSSTQVVQLKESNSGFYVEKRGGSTSILQALKSGPIAMKRSVSSGAKFYLSRYGGTNKNSILPL